MKKMFALMMLGSSLMHANCTVFWNQNPLEKRLHDPLFLLLSQTDICPGNIHDLKQLFKQEGVHEQISMVANRGKNNPEKGSFSFFESVYGTLSSGESIDKGDFFLGYFTGLEGTTIVLDQQPEDRKLLIEVIAWDKQKELYNFYELRGMKSGASRWFYRGDSEDAYKDNTWLYRENPRSEPHFGNRMRCSACHNSGGPILKELSKPHNDWWTVTRHLNWGTNQPDNQVQDLIAQVIDADLLADDVNTGNLKLSKSNKIVETQKKLSLQEQLRPLFCTTEINIESSSEPETPGILIPSAFWLNPLLGKLNLSISTKDYEKLLMEFDMHFPETTFKDADHAWLTPVKGESDIKAINYLIEHKVINRKFAEAVLMIDFTHPLFSSQRCDLLKLLPEQRTADWRVHFLENLRQNRTQFKGATMLADYIENDGYNHKVFMDKIQHYRHYMKQLFTTHYGLRLGYKKLIEARQAVFSSELSQNPLGQILEPGFRVIFPESRISDDS